jgi:hypothetical protein
LTSCLPEAYPEIEIPDGYAGVFLLDSLEKKYLAVVLSSKGA